MGDFIIAVIYICGVWAFDNRGYGFWESMWWPYHLIYDNLKQK